MLYLIEWDAHRNAHCLGLIAPGYDAAIVVGEYDDSLSIQIRTEDPFA